MEYISKLESREAGKPKKQEEAGRKKLSGLVKLFFTPLEAIPRAGIGSGGV
jgi:hypothetical protein